MIEKFLRLFKHYREALARIVELQAKVEELTNDLSLLKVERNGLKDQLDAYKISVRELGVEKAFLQDRFIEAKNDLARLQDDLLKIVKDSMDSSRPKLPGKPIDPIYSSRIPIHRLVDEKNREFFKDLKARLSEEAEITA